MKHSLNIGFVGLTHLGLNYLAATSEKGFKVVAIDLNKEKINKLKKFHFEHDEPNLKNVINKNKKKIFFSSDLNNLKYCGIIFVSQDVKTNKKGKGDLKNLKKLITKISKFINSKSVLVILSQVQPGFTRMINFEKSRLYYQVETLVFGRALERALKPERIIIGSKDSESKINPLLLKYLNNFNCPIIKMKYESAELTKISINILLASSITTTNMLAEACEKVSADWHEILPALKLDERIGKKAYLKPGLGISGGNIERDIYSIKKVLKSKKQSLSIVTAFQRNSAYMKSWVYRILRKEKILSKKNKFNIGILGLAYKENTNSVKNSPTIDLLKKIKNTKINIYDPKTKLNFFSKNFIEFSNFHSLVKSSNVIILMTPWPEFSKINKIAKNKKKIILIDPHRIANSKLIKNKNITYFTIGKK